MSSDRRSEYRHKDRYSDRDRDEYGRRIHEKDGRPHEKDRRIHENDRTHENDRRTYDNDRKTHEKSKYSSSKSSISEDSYHTSKKKKKKKGKKKKYESSESSSSEESSSDDDELKLMKKLEKRRTKDKLEKNKSKELLKKMELPEEKRLRRLQKKEAKEKKRKAKMGWDNEYLHFTNADNPYGDNNLLETFMWDKKLKKEGLANLSKDQIQKCNRMKMEENRQELEKVKKRRQERELEREEREKLMEMEQRNREAAQFSEFSRQEDTFQLEQARLRSQIRINDGRAKPIDLLAHYVNSEGDINAVDMHEPYTHLTGLTLRDLEDLIEDIKIYTQLEKQDENQLYWSDLTTIVQDEIRRLRQRDSAIEDAISHRHGIHASVAQDVSKVFQNKTVQELSTLQHSIEQKLVGPTAGVDVGYWESLLSQLKAHQARARLRERHRDNLKKKLEMLKAEQGVWEDDKDVESNAPSGSKEPVKQENQGESSKGGLSDDEVLQPPEDDPEGDAGILTCVDSYMAGSFSPKLFTPDELDPGTIFSDPLEDEHKMLWARTKVTGRTAEPSDRLTVEEKDFRQEMEKTMTNDTAQFSVEAKLDPQHYLWSDKYRPRKPRYFNRVHTGFEWNKYNQTHYDMDNPPPKIVQGYKFNIFYPDLIDKSQTPQYELLPIDGSQDFGLLKFTAGPPYEDIAFKIVNREWEYSYKRGFRCQFQNNIFQLWFHFKRYRYRR